MKETTTATFVHDGITITVKEKDGQERYFIYSDGFNNWGSEGWRDIRTMVMAYRTFKGRIDTWINSEEGRHMLKHCSRQYYETLQALRQNKTY